MLVAWLGLRAAGSLLAQQPFEELREAMLRGSSVLVYQHYPRIERSRFIPFLADRLGEEVGAARVNAFATPHVAFFLAHHAAHQAAADRATVAVQATWRGQIDVWPSVPAAV
jgi:hypothetical protein